MKLTAPTSFKVLFSNYIHIYDNFHDVVYSFHLSVNSSICSSDSPAGC